MSFFFDFLSAHDMSLDNLRADARRDLRRLVPVRRHLARRNELTGQPSHAKRNGFDPLGASLRPEATMGPGAPGAVALGQDAGQAVVGSGRAMWQARGCERGGGRTWGSKRGIGSAVRVVVVAGNLECADVYVEEETTQGWGHVRSGGGLVLLLQGMGIEARLLSVETKRLDAAAPPSEAPQGDFTCADSRAAASGLKAAAWSTAHAAVLTEVAQSRASVVHVACPATPAGLLLQWVRSPLVVSEADALAVLSEVAPAIDHASFCDAAASAFEAKWPGRSVNRRMLAVSELERIPELMAIYERYAKWEWRFGESPGFSHSLEHKFDWALVDVHVDGHERATFVVQEQAWVRNGLPQAQLLHFLTE